jgi:hypothetical protein
MTFKNLISNAQKDISCALQYLSGIYLGGSLRSGVGLAGYVNVSACSHVNGLVIF